MSRPRNLLAGAVGALALGMAVLVAQPVPEDPFPHDKHARVFPSCTTCHAGMAEAGSPVWPEPVSCDACHDGVTEDRVNWSPRVGPRATNLQFDHLEHTRESIARNPGDSALLRSCSACHNQSGAPRMTVEHAVSARCIDCHEPSAEHLEVTDEPCSTCHLPLAEARELPVERIAAFPTPPSHQREGFILGLHGEMADSPAGDQQTVVASSCATCHARDFCITCHVNAPEVAAIQALAADERSLVFETELPKPVGHAGASFLQAHGTEAGQAEASCANCHTQASCTTCHAGRQSREVTRLAMPGPGRAAGAHTVRSKPVTHTMMFTEGHGPDANARPSTCESCHVRPDCLDCHRPDPAGGAGYHPQGFLVRHPSAANNRDATCSDCHNPAQFCQSCHQQSGLVATGRLGGAAFHDAAQAFFVGHGSAARQNLESCASCHTERDCTACHSAVGGGFRFNPHGPGFNGDRMRRKNPSVCIACHGLNFSGNGP